MALLSGRSAAGRNFRRTFIERDCQVRRTLGQVVLKGLHVTARDLQAATNLALESRREILSQVVPPSRQMIL
ncbi:hypothetical protein HFO91_06025 [Rhizobium leguminosarum]|uniref:hypothetical protein n=1 Tax=Rhizobium leguminosarum TaxID=384 RepID=UPI001C982D29|nr:hypothetical protein [Rhizobium leguminosarum]MBY5449220.1 hypothetical protein [Rhizobium leguminosarum]